MAGDGELCVHDMLPGTCTYCDAPSRASRAPRGGTGDVYVTAAGDSYHDSPECGALVGGQQGAHSQDMNVRPVEPVPLDEAARRGKTRCGFCQPRR